MDFEKISVSESKRRVRAAALAFETGYHIFHISWFTPQTGFSGTNAGLDLESLYPDCDFVMTTMALSWRDANSIVAVIIAEDVDFPNPDIKDWLDDFYIHRWRNAL